MKPEDMTPEELALLIMQLETNMRAYQEAMALAVRKRERGDGEDPRP